MLCLVVVVAWVCALVSPMVRAQGTHTHAHVHRDNNSTTTGPRNGTVLTWKLPGCDDDTIFGPSNTWSLFPDDCLKVSTATSFRIQEPVICANGTRAKLARYEGRDCNYGEVTVDGGLVDVTDDVLNTCQYISPEGYKPDADHASIASFGFYCEGRKTPRDENGDGKPDGPTMGSFSLNTCPIPGDPPRAPTWRHPMPGECSAILRTERLEIYKDPTCKDGKPAKLALWYDGNRSCKGDYNNLTDVRDDMIRKCFSVSTESHSSFSFLCDDSNGGGTTRGVLQGGVAVIFASFWVFMLVEIL